MVGRVYQWEPAWFLAFRSSAILPTSIRETLMKRLALAGVMTGVLSFALAGVGVRAASQVRLCHFTGDKQTPYVVIEMSPSGAYHAHYPHHEDIIPPFQYQGVTYSRNWDAEGQAIWNNGCVPPASSDGGTGGGTTPPQVHPRAVRGDPTVTG